MCVRLLQKGCELICSTSWVPPPLPPPFSPLLSVNYIKGPSHSVNDIPLSSIRVNTHRVCVSVNVCVGMCERVNSGGLNLLHSDIHVKEAMGAPP